MVNPRIIYYNACLENKKNYQSYRKRWLVFSETNRKSQALQTSSKKGDSDSTGAWE